MFSTAASSLFDYLCVPQMHSNFSDHVDRGNEDEEVSIRIISSRDEERAENRGVELEDGGEFSSLETPNFDFASENLNREYRDGVEGNSSYQRYDFQLIGRWLEHIVPFSLLLLVVFIRQHLLGFFGTIWVSVVLFKSNDLLRKQTALKGDRKTYVLLSIIAVFILHVASIYWLYPNNDLIYPLILLPTQETPPFWHAVFLVIVNDTMVRQVAMILKCLLLIYFKNSGCHNYRKQGQMLTLIEYTLLFYRALLPTPVWYSFFLNKENINGRIYLILKFTSGAFSVPASAL
jgi:hypothetical protein